MPNCFVIQPFDGGRFDKRYQDVFKPAIEATDLVSYRVDHDPAVDVPIDEIERGIRESAMCLADITTDNPNVWYEVGYATAVRRPLCLVCSNERTTKFPFDIQHRAIIKYNCESSSDFDALRTRITERLQALLKSNSDLTALADGELLATADGLSSHEVAVLCVLIEHDLYDEGSLAGPFLVRAMESAGFTGIAAGVAVSSLVKRNMVTAETCEDRDWNNRSSYRVFRIASAGRDWMIRNQTSVRLIVSKGTRPSKNSAPPYEPIQEDDIPF